MNGLVLEGGGMRGLYTAGVLDCFLEHHIQFDVVIGVSAGACNALSYLSGQKKRNYHVNIDYINDKRYMSLHNLLHDGCLFNEFMLFHKIPKKLLPFDYEAFRQSKTALFSCSTSCLTGKPVYHRIMNFDADHKPVLASMSLPLVSKMVSYQGDLLLDGGIADPIPVKQSFAAGCDKILVVLTRENGYQKAPEKILKPAQIAYRKFPKLIGAIANRHIVYNQTLNECTRLQAEGKAFLIRPDQKVEIKRTEKNTQKLDALYRLGYEDAERQIESIRTFLKVSA